MTTIRETIRKAEPAYTMILNVAHVLSKVSSTVSAGGSVYAIQTCIETSLSLQTTNPVVRSIELLCAAF